MSAIINFNIDLSKLPKDKVFVGKKGKYISLTASVNNETRYGNNVSFSISQSPEERENKEPKLYVGNGKVVWNDGSIENAVKEEQNNQGSDFDELRKVATNNDLLSQDDDLPF